MDRPPPHPAPPFGALGLSPLDQFLLPLPNGAPVQGQQQGSWSSLPGGLPGNPAELHYSFLPPEMLLQQPGMGNMAGTRPFPPDLARPSSQQQQQQQQQQPPLPKQQNAQTRSLDKDAKQALARQKNREAQQRFRERQRAKLQEANVEYDKISEEVEKLRLENDALAKQNNIMEKVLTVRDAMMRAFDEFKSVTTQQELACLEGQTAEGLMHAIKNLPTKEDMDTFASSSEASPSRQEPQHQGHQGQGRQQNEQQGHSASGRAGVQEGAPAGTATGEPRTASPTVSDASTGTSGGKAGEDREPKRPSPGPMPDGPAGSLWAAMRSISARGVEIDGSVLGRASVIPPPDNHDLVRRIQHWTQPSDLLDYWRQWQADVASCIEAGDAKGWGAADLEEVEELMADAIGVWWHAAQMKPGYLGHLIKHGTRQNPAAEDAVSRTIAERIGPEINEHNRRLIRKAWQQYMRRLAKAAVGMSRWVQRLHQMAEPLSVESMRSIAAGAVEIGEITHHMRMAVHEEYLASMEFLANLDEPVTNLQKIRINYLASPYLPDWVAIAYYILRQDPSETVLLQLPAAVTAPVALQALSGAAPQRVVADRPLQQRLPPVQQQQQQQGEQGEEAGGLQAQRQ